jgi:hypothetical protein
MRTLAQRLAAVGVGAALLTAAPASASYPVTPDARVASVTTAATAPVNLAPVRPGSVSVSIPRVAFTADVRVTGDRLRTPVLANASAPDGVAVVLGARSSCVRPLEPGRPAWLDCRVRTRGPVVVVAVLRDGTIAVRVARP